MKKTIKHLDEYQLDLWISSLCIISRFDTIRTLPPKSVSAEASAEMASTAAGDSLSISLAASPFALLGCRNCPWPQPLVGAGARHGLPSGGPDVEKEWVRAGPGKSSLPKGEVDLRRVQARE